ncbi:DUF2326 domain-containing protein [Crenothrix sp.]|uniref:DUF2326 domain-containing protein n=1 Tax=Crenothrix sp. TaxID=3100433 RepID=UPI00374CB310
MQLLELSIYKNKSLVRNIHFKKGLNLIINSASSSNKTGNSVGKSTLSRLLDYIFLSSGEDIYTEPEFSKVIPEVYSFISNNIIYVELYFKGHDQRNYKIGRTLTTSPKDSVFYVDGKISEKINYITLVSKQIFGQTSEKPSIRTIAHKFIRNTHEKMQNTTRFLHNTTRPDVYDQLYLFLFGFTGLELLRDKASLNNQIKTKNKHLSAYRAPHRESALQKMISPLKAEGALLQNRINDFDFKESQETDVKELVDIQRRISDSTIEYSNIKTRLNYLDRSILKLRENASSVDGRELSAIYEEAGVVLNGNLKRSYEDLLVFHNQVISNKIHLLISDYEEYRLEENKIKRRLDKLHELESGIFKHIKEPDTLKSIGQIYNELSIVKEQIAGISTLLHKIEDTKALIESLENKKKEIILEISRNTQILDENVEKFNEYFGALSKYFYGDRYIFDLEFDSEKEKCRFEIVNLAPNPTGGKKKGELSAFDLAYIEFINFKKLKRPTFIVHDSIEDVDVNQVFDIFQKANQLEGQYIVSLLSDKIAGSKFSNFKKDSIILELSEDDKFFKI